MSVHKIVLVEDEGIVSNDLRHYLTQLGYTVTASKFTGEEALEFCRCNPPDVILIDIGLQGEIDGIETAKRIKQELDIPVIFITGFADEQTIGRARNTHPAGLLLKPIDEERLRSSLEQLFTADKSEDTRNM